MAQQYINIGTNPNDGTGDVMRVSFTKVDNNFSELYSTASNLTSNLANLSTALNTFEGQILQEVGLCYDTANGAYAFANAQYTAMNAAFTMANLVNSLFNGAVANAAAAFDYANSTVVRTNAVYSLTNASFIVANSAYDRVNTLSTKTNTVFGVANAAFDQANLAFIYIGAAFDEANSGLSYATDLANKVYGAFTAANGACSNAAAAFTRVNSVYTLTNSAYDTANSAYNTANGGFRQANAAYAQANLAYSAANAAFDNSNNAFYKANSAYDLARSAKDAASGIDLSTKLDRNNGVATGLLRSSGDFQVDGRATLNGQLSVQAYANFASLAYLNGGMQAKYEIAMNGGQGLSFRVNESGDAEVTGGADSRWGMYKTNSRFNVNPFIVFEASSQLGLYSQQTLHLQGDSATDPIHFYDGSGNPISWIDNGGNYYKNSDENLKENINDLKYGLKEVLQLSAKTYNLKSESDIREEHNKKPVIKIGLIAQEVQHVMPELVHVDYAPIVSANNITTTYTKRTALAIDYDSLVPILINAIQELNDKLEKLSKK